MQREVNRNGRHFEPYSLGHWGRMIPYQFPINVLESRLWEFSRMEIVSLGNP